MPESWKQALTSTGAYGQPFQMQVWARYCDTWSRRDGHWAIDHRNTVIDFDLMSAVTPLHDHQWARRDPQDPSYAVLKGL